MTLFELFPGVHRILRSAHSLRLGAALLVATFTLASTLAVAQFAGPTPLTLVNGWTNAPFSTSNAEFDEENGIVQFRGAISSGTSAVAFTLPAAFSPAHDVFIPVDLCNATKGRLHITSAGVVDVEAEGGTFSNAQCFTSLDGASFAVNLTNFTNLTLINGWTSQPFGTRIPGVALIATRVHFKGAIATTGTNTEPFTLPAGFRPPADVFLPIDLCNATNGRLHITSAGVVDVEAEGGTFSNAQCFTSLEGVWFALQAGSITPITLQNGWTNAPFSTSIAEAIDQWGTVYLKGAIATAGTNPIAFTLPPRFSPVTNVYVNVDLCNATKGRLYIQTNGVVTVQAETSFSDAQCFTSLDGASFRQ